MTIHLPEPLESSNLAAVASGRFASVDDAMAKAASLLVQHLKHENERERAKAPGVNQVSDAPAHKPIWEIKEYSLTDCVSMEVMWREGITDILTHDSHLSQEGFTILL